MIVRSNRIYILNFKGCCQTRLKHTVETGPTTRCENSLQTLATLGIIHFFLILFIYIFRERGRKGEREGKKHQRERKTLISCLSYIPWLGNKPTTQACALTKNRTGNLSLCRTIPNQLSHVSQSGIIHLLILDTMIGNT